MLTTGICLVPDSQRLLSRLGVKLYLFRERSRTHADSRLAADGRGVCRVFFMKSLNSSCHLFLPVPDLWSLSALGHNVSAGINYTACCCNLWCLLQFMFLLSWFNLIQVIYLFSLSTEDTPRPVFTVRYLLLPVTGLLISCLWNLVLLEHCSWTV